MRLTRLFTTDYFFYDCNKLDKLFHKPTPTPPKVHSLPCLEQIKAKLGVNKEIVQLGPCDIIIVPLLYRDLD